jgi:hypothetical protein
MALVPARLTIFHTWNERFRIAELAIDQRSIVLVLLCLLLAGCPLTPPSPYQFAEGLPARAVHTAHSAAPEGGLSRGMRGYNLYIAVASIGLDVSTGKSHLLTRAQGGHPSKRTITGHSWLILERPGKRIEVGHTPDRPILLNGVKSLAKKGDPNPVSYLWQDLRIGRRHGHLLGLRPTFVLRLPLTTEQSESVEQLLATYDFAHFSVVGHDCSDLVVQAARLAGVDVDYQVDITLPPTKVLYGRAFRFWTDEKYRELIIACPDVLEASLRRLALQNVGEDFTAKYGQRAR